MGYRDVTQRFFKWWRGYIPSAAFRRFTYWNRDGSLVNWIIDNVAVNNTPRGELMQFVVTVDGLGLPSVAPVRVLIDWGFAEMEYMYNLWLKENETGVAIIDVPVPIGATLGPAAYTVTAQQDTYSDTVDVLVGIATVTSTEYTVNDGAGTITDGASTITIATLVGTFLGNLVKRPLAEWKVVAAATVVTDATEFDAAIGRDTADTLVVGDKLAVKAVDDTIKVYAITVTP